MTDAPLRVHGSESSYFTGKLEAYLLYKEIPYELVPANAVEMRRHLGRVFQVPAVELPDGRWLTDTTPMIAWFEARHPAPAVLPADPVVAFASRLLEDYADEWLWRPAMHYRWFFREDAHHRSDKLARELGANVPLSLPIKRLLVRTRQRMLFTRGDGVSRSTRAHVEATYHRALEQLGAVLADRPFLLGGAPSLVDFGFFGSMFRHFASDPTPAALMRETAPAVHAWVTRVWEARASRIEDGLETRIPDAWGPLLAEAGATHLQNLAANAAAWTAGRRRFDFEVEGVRYRRLHTSRYRVACLEALRGHFEALPEPARTECRALLERHGCWEPLFRVSGRPSGLEPTDPFAPAASMIGLGPISSWLVR